MNNHDQLAQPPTQNSTFFPPNWLQQISHFGFENIDSDKPMQVQETAAVSYG